MASRRVKVELALLTLAFALTGLVFAIGTPLFQAPDEPQHLDLVHHYAHRPLDLAGPDLRVRQGTRQAVADVGLRDYLAPVSYEAVPKDRPTYRSLDEPPGARKPAVTGCPVTCQNYHYAHPQLPYLLVAPVARLFEESSAATLVLVLRVLGVLLVAPVVALTWFAATQLWGTEARRPVAAAAVVAFAGPVAATAAAVNNDALTLLLAAALAAVVARVVTAGYHPRLAALLGAVVAAGMWTKAHFLVLAPVALAAVVVVAPTHRWREAGKRLALPLGVGAVWWLFTLVRLGGLAGESEILSESRAGPWRHASFLDYVLERTPDVVSTGWGMYGWLAIRVPGGWRTALTVSALAVSAGWAASRRWSRPTRRTAGFAVLAAIPLLLAVASLWASFSVYRASGERRGVAGRYLYPAIPVMALGATAALGTIADRLRFRAAREETFARGITIAAVIGSAGSTAVALHGLYDTRSVALLLERAAVVSPWALAPVVLPLLVVAWMATLGVLVWSVLRSRP